MRERYVGVAGVLVVVVASIVLGLWGSAMDVAWTLMIAALALGIYFLPTIIAGSRNVPNFGSVFVLNLFLGWTLIGWVVALAMAARSVPNPAAQTAPAVAPVAAAPSMYRECQHCKEQMRRDASVCPHCRLNSDPWTLNDGAWWRKNETGSWEYLDETAGTWRPQGVPPGEAQVATASPTA